MWKSLYSITNGQLLILTVCVKLFLANVGRFCFEKEDKGKMNNQKII